MRKDTESILLSFQTKTLSWQAENLVCNLLILVCFINFNQVKIKYNEWDRLYSDIMTGWR